jgi:hypothetical protein
MGACFSVIGFTIGGDKVVEMDILADPDRLSRLDLSASSAEPLASSHMSRSLRHGCEGHHGRRTSRWSRCRAAGCYLTPRAAWLSATVGQQERDAV